MDLDEMLCRQMSGHGRTD